MQCSLRWPLVVVQDSGIISKGTRQLLRAQECVESTKFVQKSSGNWVLTQQTKEFAGESFGL